MHDTATLTRPAERMRVNLMRSHALFLRAVPPWLSKSLGRSLLWQSPILWLASRSRSVWSAAVYRRFSTTVLCAFPYQSGAEAHALQTLRATAHVRARAASVQGPHLSRTKVDAYAQSGTPSPTCLRPGFGRQVGWERAGVRGLCRVSCRPIGMIENFNTLFP